MSRPLHPLKVLVAKPGLDGHDVGAKVLCRYLMDAGMEVVYTGLRRSPADIARTAADEDVHVVALSILSGAHLPLCEKLLGELERAGSTDVLVFVGGNIPARDVDRLHELGVDRAFATGSHPEDVIECLQEIGRSGEQS